MCREQRGGRKDTDRKGKGETERERERESVCEREKESACVRERLSKGHNTDTDGVNTKGESSEKKANDIVLAINPNPGQHLFYESRSRQY